MVVRGVKAPAEVNDVPWDQGPPKLLPNRIYCTWDWGYRLIAMCEHYLLTRNPAELPAIRGMAVTLAKGQNAGGLWGHQLATPERNGRLPGYAQMNQPSLSCFLGLVLAQQCGVKDRELTQAINVLANLNIEEGIDKALAIESMSTGKHSFEMLATWAALAKYGANAKPALEELRTRYKGRFHGYRINT